MIITSNPVIDLSLYIAAFFVLWVAAGFIIDAVSLLAKQWRLPAFTVSFFVLGLFTSLPEAMIGISAVLNNQPLIFAGNLFGGITIIFLAIIPLLGLISGGVKTPHTLSIKHLLATLAVVLVPFFFSLNLHLSRFEGAVMICAYLTLFIFLPQKRALLFKVLNSFYQHRLNDGLLLLKILFGIVLLYGASSQILFTTQHIASSLNISPFIISMTVVAIGTNIPELSLIFRAVLKRKIDIALADYLGSAAVNTLLFGVFTLWHGKGFGLPGHYQWSLTAFLIGLTMFFFFIRSKQTLSRTESFILLCWYAACIGLEVMLNLQ